jgi:hypothetical protein
MEMEETLAPKEEYTTPKMELIWFESDDIITTSTMGEVSTQDDDSGFGSLHF